MTDEDIKVAQVQLTLDGYRLFPACQGQTIGQTIMTKKQIKIAQVHLTLDGYTAYPHSEQFLDCWYQNYRRDRPGLTIGECSRSFLIWYNESKRYVITCEAHSLAANEWQLYTINEGTGE